VTRPVLLVIGAGPGVGGSVARRFGAAGYDVGLVARRTEPLVELAATLEGAGVRAGWATADVTDAEQLTGAVMRLAGHVGRVDVLHFNPSAYRPRTALELTAAELAEDVTLGVGALLTAVQAARPFLTAGARVTATGSSAADRPSSQAASLGVQKAGLRNLLLSLDQILRRDGIRAVSVTVDGVLAPADPSSPFHPDRVADAIFTASQRPEEGWTAEVALRAG